jgi:hypothetical protein
VQVVSWQTVAPAFERMGDGFDGTCEDFCKFLGGVSMLNASRCQLDCIVCQGAFDRLTRIVRRV